MAERPTDTTSQAVPDTTGLYRLIHTTRRLLRSSWVATGLGLTAGIGIGTLLALALLDLLAPLAQSLRLVALLLVVVPSVYLFVTGVLAPLFRRLTDALVARRIERHIPGIHSRLVSCVDLSRPEARAQYPVSFYRRLVTEALDRVKSFRPSMVVDFLSLRRSGAIAGGAAVAFLLVMALFSDRLPTAMARLFSPFADIPPATGVAYTVTVESENGQATPDAKNPAVVRVLRGEDITFLVNVEKGAPERLQLRTRPDGDAELKHDVPKPEAGSRWKLTLTGLEQSFDYRVYGGGTWTTNHRVVLVDRPKLVGIHTKVHFPEYMGITEPAVGPPQTAEVSGPDGGQVEVVVQTEGQVADAEIQFVEKHREKVVVKDRPEDVWFEGSLPPGARTEGKGNWQWQDVDGKTAHTDPAAIGSHGHWFDGVAAARIVQSGEVLFASVYLAPGQRPESVMLEWFDGAGWEHRAFWGADKIKNGKQNSPGYRFAGELPKAGGWVRLEVPAEQVGLNGKSVHGMGFRLFGGQAFWGRCGTVPPATIERDAVHPVKTFAMAPAGENQWSGKFPLHGTGLYRVELRNELKAANRPMKEARYTAITDQPPQVVLEAPGADLPVSSPIRVPLVISAFDDFALADARLVILRTEKGPAEEVLLKKYATPVRNDNFTAQFDLAAKGFKVGDSVKYRVEVRDRKGQVATTPAYTIRIAPDGNAADKQLADFEKSQDPNEKKLAELIASQKKVNQAIEKTTAKYAPLMDKLKALEAAEKERAAAEPADPKDDPAKPDPAKPTAKSADKALKLDPESAKLLDEMRKELTELSKEESKNVETGKQLANELKKAAEDAGKLKMLPKPVLEEMQNLDQVFRNNALDQMQELVDKLTQASATPPPGAAQANAQSQPNAQTQQNQPNAQTQQNQPNQPNANQAAPPPLSDKMLATIKEKSERVEKELQAVQDRMKSLAEARKGNKTDDELAKLKEAMEQQNAALTARELQELKDYIDKLRKEMKLTDKDLEALQDATKTAAESELPSLENREAMLEKTLDKMLADAKNLKVGDAPKKMKKRPNFPNAPYAPESDETAPPKEEDGTDPLPEPKGEAKGDKSADKNKQKADAEDDEDKTYAPQLDPNQKRDPRYKDRAADAKKDKRGKLLDREATAKDELESAEHNLEADENAIARMLNQLKNAMQGKKPGQKPSADSDQNDPQSAAEQAAMQQLMQSEALRKAMAMAQAMKQAQRGQGQKGQGQAQAQANPSQSPSQSPVGNTKGSPLGEQQRQAELAKLDIATRAVIMKMQPRVREELLQGMREEGPEGYKRFIQDYFRKLTDAKGNGQK